MVLGAVLFIHVKGYRVDGVQRVVADAAGKAASRLLTQGAEGFHLLYQVIGAVVHMGEKVDFLSRQVGFGGQQLLKFGCPRHIIGQGDGIYMGNKGGVVCHAIDFLPHIVNLRLDLAQTLPVIVTVYHTHSLKPRIFSQYVSSGGIHIIHNSRD